MNQTIFERFWEKVDKNCSNIFYNDERCWEWIGGLNERGYGNFWIGNNEKNKMMGKAHRFSWEINVGIIPKDKHVLHHCDNRSCVNPKHLWLGTHEENMLDKKTKKRTVGSVDYKRYEIVKRTSDKYLKHKLKNFSSSEILEIRRLCSEKTISRKQIAEKYGVNVNAIHKIAARKTYRFV